MSSSISIPSSQYVTTMTLGVNPTGNAGTLDISSFTNLTQLRAPGLGLNAIVNSGFNSPKLTYVDISVNSITGALPEINNATGLKNFYGNFNRFTGTIPQLTNNPQLLVYNCAYNSLSGRIPSLSNNPLLSTFYCNNNANLTGPIPSLTANTGLGIFYAYSCSITGTIPPLNANTQLTVFSCFANNTISGQIPSLSANTKLTVFTCANNSLTGAIPSLAANTGITQFLCSSNQLSSYAGGGVSNTLGDFRAQVNNLSSTAVNTILADFVAANRTTGTRTLNIGGAGNATPNGQGLTDKSTLISRGWTVTTN